MLVLCYIFESRNGEAFKCNECILFLLKGARQPVWLQHDPHLIFKEITVICLKCGCSKRVLYALWSFSASRLSRGDKTGPATLLKNTESRKHIPHYHFPFFGNTCFKIRNEHNYLHSADGKWNIRGMHYYCYCYYYYWSSRKCSAIKTLLSSHSLLQTIKGSLHTCIYFLQTEFWIIILHLTFLKESFFEEKPSLDVWMHPEEVNH